MNDKVLRIKTGEFLFDMNDKSIATCRKIQDAMDISGWTFEQLEYIMSNLHKVGYTSVEVVERKKEIK